MQAARVWPGKPSESLQNLSIHPSMQTEPSSTMQTSPLVSVAITSYNSETWIHKAIESALAQRTEFPFEILIADDCSTDGTVAVAESYRARNPDIVRVLARPQNVGTQRNYYDLFEQCRGKYIAWLDADDYWTDPEKLSLQTKALEDDPSVMVCGHFVRQVTKAGKVVHDRFPRVSAGRHGMVEILAKCFLASPSVVFRNGLQLKLPEWYFEISPITDWLLYVVAALSGDILMLDRVMADYTCNDTSALWGKGYLFLHTINADFYERVESVLPAEFHRLVRQNKGKQYEEMAYLLRKQGRFSESRQAAVKAFFSPSLLDNLGSKSKSLIASLVREAQWRLNGAQPVSEQQ
jgi:glycosyltransferase involved in cell wall biosynthesis